MAIKIYRIIYVFFSYIALCSSDEPIAFAKGLFIFSAGLLYDYWSVYNHGGLYNKILGFIALIPCVFFLGMSILITQGYMQLKIVEDILVCISTAKLSKFAFDCSTNWLILFIVFAFFEIFGGVSRNGKNSNSNPSSGNNMSIPVPASTAR